MKSKPRGRPPGPSPVESYQSAHAYLLVRRPAELAQRLVAMAKFPKFDQAQKGIRADALDPPRAEIEAVAHWLRLVALSDVPSILTGKSGGHLLQRASDLAKQLTDLLTSVDAAAAARPRATDEETLSVAELLRDQCEREGTPEVSGPELAAIAVLAGLERPVGSDADLRAASEQRWAQAKRRARSSADRSSH